MYTYKLLLLFHYDIPLFLMDDSILTELPIGWLPVDYPYPYYPPARQTCHPTHPTDCLIVVCHLALPA